MKKRDKVTVGITAVVIIVLGIVLLIRSGKFDKDPVVEIIPENRYSDTLFVITDQDYRPYSFYDDKGNCSGHDVELIAILANTMHMNLDLKFMSWNEGIAATVSGKAQVLMTCDYSDTFSGTEVLAKSEPLSSDEFIAYSKNRISSVNELYTKRIGIMRNGNVQAHIDMLHLAGNCITYDDNRMAMQALIDGKVDCAIMRNTVGTVLSRELKAKGIKGYQSIGQSYMCLGINRDFPELEKRINKALESIKADGELQTLNDKWLTTFVKPYSFRETVADNIWLVIGFGLVLFIMILIQARSDKRAKEKLQDAMLQLETANKAKTDFLFNMSHDFRTPMNAIIGFTAMAKKDLDNKAHVKDCLEKIETSGGHLQSLINEVLDMSRIEAGKLKSDLTAIDVSELSQKIATICHESAGARNIELSFKEKDIKDRLVMGDELHINRVLMNIMDNAIKFTLPGGSISFSVTQTKSAVSGYGRYEFTVQDNGIGISQAFLPSIFEPFSREQNQTVSGIQGTGLGMTIVKHLIDYMDGTINIESVRGQGTTVTVALHLKFADNKEKAGKSDSSSVVSLRGKKVLLVEDNELNREIATVMLEEKGLVVETAVNGIEAVDRVVLKGVRYYDLVLMDIQMPMKNGYEATRDIRKLPGANKLTIIALSANAFDEDRKESMAAGMNDHLAKPIDPEQLTQTLMRYLH